mmetsp:Transcript_98575/g.287590  ORF Transcript_98575/g.287590 Transcript_98575/m.287590 type:complete len:821 (+) Transcript_98575:10-2472(+)
MGSLPSRSCKRRGIHFVVNFGAMRSQSMVPLLAFLCLIALASGAEYHWIVQEDVAAPDGYPRSIIAVMDKRFLEVVPNVEHPHNDRRIYQKPQQIPGPELRVKQGERVVIHVENHLPSTEISIHWHGLHMRGQAWMDGTAGVTGCPIPSGGGTGTYDFIVDQSPGTHWWHSHVSAQYADGLFGAIVIEPAEGDSDVVMDRVPYTHDQVLTLQDWLHETYYDISARYNTRIGAFTQTYQKDGVTLPFMPDYPWPSSYILLNGRGQTDCKWRLWRDCSEVRLKGWEHHLDHARRPRSPKPLIKGLPTGTYGQCMPERPPLMGECNPDAEPAVLQCQSGGATRLRLINTGFSMPLRFWVQHHKFMVVARDGVPVRPTGPHFAVVIAVGQRIDIIVQCDQSPDFRYKAFAMVALREFYPGSYKENTEASSYAVVDYDGNEDKQYAEADVSPSHFVQAGLTEGCTIGCNHRDKIYCSWKIPLTEYVPWAIEERMVPAPARGDLPVTAPPAQQRLLMSVGGMGNWWNNESNAESQFGLKFEWWNLNAGSTWTDSRSPLRVPATEPVMISKLFGRSIEETYGTSDPRRLPYVERLLYNPTSPITYEVVLVNHEGQQHPFHIHGHTLQMISHGWLDPDAKWKTRLFNASHYDPQSLVGPTDINEYAPVMSELDTFTLAPHSYVVFRLTANNPGAWLMHCHMDYHLDAGQGMLWSVESEDGKYVLPPPPDSFRVCHRAETFGARHARMKVSEDQLSVAASEIARLKQLNAAYLQGLMGLVVGLGVLVGLLLARGTRKPRHRAAAASEADVGEETRSQVELREIPVAMPM